MPAAPCAVFRGVISMHLLVAFHDLRQKLQLYNNKLGTGCRDRPFLNWLNANRARIRKPVRSCRFGTKKTQRNIRIKCQLKRTTTPCKSNLILCTTFKMIIIFKSTPNKSHLQLECDITVAARYIDQIRVRAVSDAAYFKKLEFLNSATCMLVFAVVFFSSNRL